MTLILGLLLAAAAPQQDKAPEACPVTTAFIFKKPPEAAPKAQPKPKTATVETLNVPPKTAPKPKADDCLTLRPKQVKRS
jgi:hypothetical protein